MKSSASDFAFIQEPLFFLFIVALLSEEGSLIILSMNLMLQIYLLIFKKANYETNFFEIFFKKLSNSLIINCMLSSFFSYTSTVTSLFQPSTMTILSSFFIFNKCLASSLLALYSDSSVGMNSSFIVDVRSIMPFGYFLFFTTFVFFAPSDFFLA